MHILTSKIQYSLIKKVGMSSVEERLSLKALKLSIPKLFNGLVGSTSRNKVLLEHHPVLLDLTDLVTVIL